MKPKHGYIDAFDSLPGVIAIFTSRKGGISPAPYNSLNLGVNTGDSPENVEQNWNIVFNKLELGSRTLIVPKLEHGTRLLEAHTSIKNLEGDAVFTQNENFCLASTSADCLTVLLYDAQTRCIATVHAGWRGTRDQILLKSLRELFKKGLLSRSETHLAFGPCIFGNRYEIGEEVAKQFSSEFLLNIGSRWHLNFLEANKAQALEFNIPSQNIHLHSECTFSDPESFFSYRRDGLNSGRMAGLLTLA